MPEYHDTHPAIEALAAICTWHGKLSDNSFERLVEQGRELIRKNWPGILEKHKQARIKFFKENGIDL